MELKTKNVGGKEIRYFVDDDGEIFDYKFIISIGKADYDWEGTYKDEEWRFVEIPVNVGVGQSGAEREVVENLLIDTRAMDECLEMSSAYEVLDSYKKIDYEGLNLFMGEWICDLWGSARKGCLIGNYCFGGYDLPDWEGVSTLELLRFWKLTDIKRIKIKKRDFTVFYSGTRYWNVDDERVNEDIDFYPVLFTISKNQTGASTDTSCQ